MMENLSEAELARLQKDSPELAAKLIGGMLDSFKRDNMVTRVKPEKPSDRYGDSTNAPYYNKAAADKALKVLEQFKEDKTSDLLVPYKIIGLSRSSCRVFYTQAANYIIDNAVEYDDYIIDVAKHIKHKATENGLRFSYVPDIAPEVMVRIPKEAAAAPEPSTQYVLNWRTQIETFLDTADMGQSITVAPTSLTDDEVQDFTEFLAGWGGLLHVVRNEKITVKKIGEATV